MSKWDQDKIKRYIEDGVEENTILEYKRDGALGTNTSKKKEIAKDVSAMANTAGGVIIYGVSEHREEHRHLPKEITPIDRTRFSREWLDQVIIHNIRPLIEGLTIHPVDIDTAPEHVVYVVEIPQSTTAHQVTTDQDYRYYERSNFVTVRMEDYRVRDVMNRATLPDAKVEFCLLQSFHLSNPPYCVHTLRATVRNTGLRAIDHFKLEFTFPYIGLELNHANSASFSFWDVNNETGGVDHHLGIYRSREVLFPDDEIAIGAEEMYPCCFRYRISDDQHESWVERRRESNSSLSWVLYADDMPPKRGAISFSQLYSYNRG